MISIFKNSSNSKLDLIIKTSNYYLINLNEEITIRKKEIEETKETGEDTETEIEENTYSYYTVKLELTYQESDVVEVARKVLKKHLLESLTVTTEVGTFDANETSRNNMMSKLRQNKETYVWKMADNSEITITYAELDEALNKSIDTVSEIIGIGVNTNTGTDTDTGTGDTNTTNGGE